MKTDGTIHRHGDGYEIVFERHLRHPPERVWTFLTQPDKIARWYIRMDLDPRVGGKVVEHHDHVGIEAIGHVVTFDPPHVLEHTSWEQDGPGTELGSVRWELSAEKGGTRLVLRNRFVGAGMAYGSLAGWHICLDILEEALAGGDPARHAPPRGTFSTDGFVQTHAGKGRWKDREPLEAAYQKNVPLP